MNIDKKLLQWWWSNVKRQDDARLATLTPTAGISETVNLDYIGDGNKYHLLDIFRPESACDKKLPVIIDIHGGGWMYGDKELNKYYCLALASRGFAVVSFSYSLFPDVTFPVPVQEIFAAINFVMDNGEKYNLDLNNIFLTGDSAGGHYVGLVASIQADANLQKLYGVKSDARFKAVAFNCAAFYPNDFGKIPLHIAKSYIRLFYNNDKNFKSNAFYKSVDIFNNRVKDFPPIYINSCFNDMLKGQNLKFIKFLNNNKIPYTFDFPKKDECKNKMGHVYTVLHPCDWEESVKSIDKLCDYFKTKIN